MIGKVERVPLREVWEHEARDFTKWLEENPDVLTSVTDLTLSYAEREHPAGGLSVDLLAEDANGNLVIIENQLGKSDHEHLGKLITYLTVIDAKTAIWIVAEPRPEHVSAITWLNECSSASFYLLKLEAIKIGDSAPAPLLTLIVGPSEESREAGARKKIISERHAANHRFWASLLERARGKTTLHAGVSPSAGDWLATGAGKTGLSFNYNIFRHEARVELYIDRGKGNEDANKKIFDALIASKTPIEEEFGGDLDWERLEGKRACRIAKRLRDGGLRDEDRWPQIQDAMIDAMIRLEKALRAHIDKLPN